MTDTAQMRDLLLQLRAELEAVAAISDASAEVVELDQSKVGRLSRMDAMQAQAMAQASMQRRELVLKKITAAIARIDNDEYGDCFSCDEPINCDRVHRQVAPWVQAPLFTASAGIRSLLRPVS